MNPGNFKISATSDNFFNHDIKNYFLKKLGEFVRWIFTVTLIEII